VYNWGAIVLERKSSGSGLEIREYGRRDPSRWQRGTLYPQRSALTSSTSDGRSVGIVHSRTQATNFFFTRGHYGLLGLWILSIIRYSRNHNKNNVSELDLFPSSDKGRETPVLLGVLETANLSHLRNLSTRRWTESKTSKTSNHQKPVECTPLHILQFHRRLLILWGITGCPRVLWGMSEEHATVLSVSLCTGLQIPAEYHTSFWS
jgi:hypothetical protein